VDRGTRKDRQLKPDISRESLAGVFEDLDWADIDQLCQAALQGGVFGPGFYSKCILAHAKTLIREVLRSGGMKDADGKVIKVASIVVVDDQTGRSRRVYKREDLFSLSDFIQVMHYHRGRAAHHKRKFKYFRSLAIRKHGDTVQPLLPGFTEKEAMA
jgi:hypothetical protein